MEKKIVETDEDYVWRFELDSGNQEPLLDDPLVEMVRKFLEDFLNIGFFVKDGEKVRVDGFFFLNNPEKIYEIFPRMEKE